MLVEINLLPRKKMKNRATFLVIILSILIALICSTILYVQVSAVKNEKQRLSNQLTSLEKKREILEQKVSTNEGANSVIKLEQAVIWADEYFVETVPLVKHLSSLLPERGFIQSFTYVDVGVVNCVIQFDSNSEVAHYLATLKKSPYLKEIKLNSITTSALTDEEPEITNSSEENVEEILPRYLAQFELSINQEELKISQKEGN